MRYVDLVVEYPRSLYLADADKSIDRKIERTVGREPDGSGCEVGRPRGRRDLHWAKITRKRIVPLRKSLLALGMRGLQVVVTPAA